ncbi:uncharacterized protein YbjT (DUF2867 family) [Rhodoligotrophos appendicifer]|uniref:SDR family oxidoreductase n=1 Tax=Rhodoligotrophos appendicifer TaxID=987056 RepID=UPI001185C68D|nr:SDR family oxidoreductase [Rhodoligotrophos appendicifer]
MRILVLGGTGLIGSSVVARLISVGHEVVGLARDVRDGALRLPEAQWVAIDLAELRDARSWLPHLSGIDAVVNCAGILQDAPGDSTHAAHVSAITGLSLACEEVGIRRFIQLSAIGVDRDAPSAFSATKRDGDAVLMARDLDWVVLRPSVVVGRRAYGGSALFRGLAGLPILPVLPDTGPLQVVQLDQVIETILFFLTPGAPSRLILDLVGPDRLSMTDIVRRYRRWLGWGEPILLSMPRWAGTFLFRLGDFAGLLGWRPPIRSTAQKEMARGAVGDPSAWIKATGITPIALDAALVAEPAAVQERWFAVLYVLKPVLFTVFSLFWIITGLLSIGPGYQIGVAMMEEGGAGELSAPSVIAGGLADLIIGLGIAFRRTTRIALLAALGISLFYALAGTLILPRLWIDPLGPMLKIWPIIVLNLIALGILRDR